MDWAEKLGSAKRTEFVREMQRKQTDGTYAAQPKTLTKNLGKLDTQIRHLESGDGATGLKSERAKFLKDFGRSLAPQFSVVRPSASKAAAPFVSPMMMEQAAAPAAAPAPAAPAAPNPFNIDPLVAPTTSKAQAAPDTAPKPFNIFPVVGSATPMSAPAPEAASATPCEILYDPCTGDPLEVNTIDELEKRVKLIKSAAIKESPETQQFPPEIRSRLDLLISLLNRPEPPSDTLFQYTINGQLYEAYWDIVLALNLMDEYKRTPSFYMVKGKAEELRSLDDPVYTNNPIEYLESRGVNMGASGASDITFCYKSTFDSTSKDPCEASHVSAESCSVSPAVSSVDIQKPRFYFCSSKYYKHDDQKGVENFDIQKIYTAAKHLHIEYDIRIVLLVKSKEAVDKKLRKAISKYIAEEASAVYGQDDLFGALRLFYDLVHQKYQGQVTKETLISILGIQTSLKPILKPRLHQHMAVLKIQKAVNAFRTTKGGSNKFLVGILPRGGKTYIAGGIVAALQPKRVVVLLGAKSETISQFTNDLFKFYQDFADYEVIDVVEGAADMQIDPVKKYIFVMSVELYKTESSKRQILINLKGGALAADLFLCDEAHLKQTTQKAIKELEEGTVKAATDIEEENQLQGLDQVIRKDVPVIYMTGTYIKPLTVFKIPPENTILWEYQDIQEGKNIVTNQEYFLTNFGSVYEEALQKSFSYGETFESIQSMYRRFPNLYLLSTQFTEDAKQAFLTQSAEGEKVGFPTISHLFQVKKEYDPFTTPSELWHTGFKNPKAMGRLINYLSPRPDVIIEGESQPISSVMKRIDRIAQRIGDRLAHFTSEFVVHSQLWFLPSMQGHPLVKRMTALAGIIFLSPWYRKHFNILAVSSSADWSKIQGAKQSRLSIQGGTFSWACPKSGETLKDCLVREESLARKEGKGVIFLAQNMLHLGISLACVDIVVLLDAGEKVDERIQKMYRALTESINKRGGFIVDLNYFRTVTAIMNYQIQATKSRSGVKEVYAEDTKTQFNTIINTYGIDDDLDIYSSKVQGGSSRIEDETVPELQRLLQSVPDARGDGITLSDVGQAVNRNIEATIGNDYSRALDDMLGEMANDVHKKVEVREEGAGVERAEEEKEDAPPREQAKLFPNSVTASPAEKRKAFLDIFKTTLKIGVFGTAYKTVPDLIEGLKRDSELRDIVVDTLIKRGAVYEGVDQARLIDRIVIPELEKIATAGSGGTSYLKMKEHFNARDSRSTRFQEVLTYIVEHLAPKDKERHKYGEVFTPLTLVDEMLSKLPTEVWSKKEYKWLDPANGIGNFPIKAFIGQTEGDYKYPGLFEGLRDEIKDDNARCKWIVENMLYMIDINGKNNLIARRLFEKVCPGAKANIEKIDNENGFLTEKQLKFNDKELKEFDVILGNPPYNPPKTETGSSGNSIWQNFVIKSYSMLNDKGYLLFVHPPGWKKPTDEQFKPEKYTRGNYRGQIRQGHVWQVLKDSGIFKFIYTNDQRSKTIINDYLPHFPAVDYYVYQKGGDKSGCDTKNVFLGKIDESKGVRLNYNLKYLPNLITKQTQDILHKVTSKEGDKPNFTRFRSGSGFSLNSSKGKYKYIYTYNKKGEANYQYSDSIGDNNVNLDKVIMNFGGGIDSLTIQYFKKEDQVGSYDKTMYSKVDSDKEGKQVEAFFKSDIVKFIFLITQYASGAITQNEPLVANSITIPPEGTSDYYKFFGIEEHKKYIEDILAHYEKFKAPKRVAKTEKVKPAEGGARPHRFTRRKNRS